MELQEVKNITLTIKNLKDEFKSRIKTADDLGDIIIEITQTERQ